MAAADARTSLTSLTFLSLTRDCAVTDLHCTVIAKDVKYLCWTRLAEATAALILNVSDGVDVWGKHINKDDMDTLRASTSFSSNNEYFRQFRLAFKAGNLSVMSSATKKILTVGSSLSFDLYEVKTTEKIQEFQHILFHLAEKNTDKASEKEDSNQERADSSKMTSEFEPVMKKPAGVNIVRRQQGHSLVNPQSRRKKQAQRIKFDEDEEQ